jgi:hypothetical protein
MEIRSSLNRQERHSRTLTPYQLGMTALKRWVPKQIDANSKDDRYQNPMG